MILLLRIIDPYVDGDGSDVECLLDVGTAEITPELRKEALNAVGKYKKEHPNDWDYDGLFQAAATVLKNRGYTAKPVDILKDMLL